MCLPVAATTTVSPRDVRSSSFCKDSASNKWSYASSERPAFSLSTNKLRSHETIGWFKSRARGKVSPRLWRTDEQNRQYEEIKEVFKKFDIDGSGKTLFISGNILPLI
jgi:hypothetical protein